MQIVGGAPQHLQERILRMDFQGITRGSFVIFAQRYHLAEKLYILHSPGIRYVSAYLYIFDIRPLPEYAL